jgi:hypothetical protein
LEPLANLTAQSIINMFFGFRTARPEDKPLRNFVGQKNNWDITDDVPLVE